MGEARVAHDPGFAITGNPKVPNRGHNGCCGKPQGCTNMNPGCAFLQHPYKRFIRGEITVAELRSRTLTLERREAVQRSYPKLIALAAEVEQRDGPISAATFDGLCDGVTRGLDAALEGLDELEGRAR